MPTREIDDFQKQALEMFRAQQEAYLDAVKAWRETIAAAVPPAGTTPPGAPAFTPAPPRECVPTPAEIAEAGWRFASKMLADQSRFLEELGRVMTAGSGPSKGGSTKQDDGRFGDA